MINKHFTIPIFVPELACPFQCIYCNQKKISGTIKQPEIKEVTETIEKHLLTIPQKNTEIELGFFGGNFTGIDPILQKSFLEIGKKYLQKGKIQGIRLSTRPDYINSEKLDLLKKYGVTTIELGAQSLDNCVLKKCNRGHNREQVEEAAKLIHQYGFKLGLQMMIGLPGDTLEKAMFTAKEIIRLGADNTRIYPCIVIKDTVLDNMLQANEYNALDMETAVEWTKHVLLQFEKANVNVIRVGLHPSETLSSGKDLIAGPYHVSFKEFVLSSIWKDILKEKTKNISNNSALHIFVSPKEINYAIGYQADNRKYLKKRFPFVKFYSDNHLENRNCIIRDENKG
ncbi:MAG: elongator complex protein 3 [Bacteroidales bacterium]